MPIYLKTIGFSIVLIGVLEGVAEAVAGLSKGYFGKLSDNSGKRIPFVQIGYAFSAISKPMMAVFIFPLWIFFARTIDRFGKGIRTSARDALISESSEAQYRGSVFGFHRAVDTMGALVGPLIALALLNKFGHNLRFIFYLAVIPSAIGIILLAIFVKDIRKRQNRGDAPSLRLQDIELSRDFKIFLIVSAVFAIGNSSDAFLILRAHDLGLSLSLTIAVYTLFNLFYAISSHIFHDFIAILDKDAEGLVGMFTV